ncbi:hypothetical protein [Cupriavidus agavae]|uniref:Uncharacterized protein n=1 Tax=Cupriavidus agavae TaxID=1001822 RepID=A0A4Q7S3Q9_9BURK|nr:hypothetical protein [Cupriavidus agavae]RZT39452.1 hypothetical protein EV147_2647 [Cupriavidus agavae]
MSDSENSGYSIIAEPSGILDPKGTEWNVQLTHLLRNTERYAWGNWTLDPAIRVGALGWFNPSDTHVQLANYQMDLQPTEHRAAVDWHLEQGHVRQTTAGVQFDVPYLDPTTGTEVTVGLQSKWEFGSKGSLTSQGSGVGVAYVENGAQYMLDNYQAIYDVAKSVNKVNGGDIVQGFGMITKVWLTDGCVNLGSRQDKSEFSITGSVDGVSAMTGSDQSASLKGSYKNTSTADNVEKRIFPSKADTVEHNDPVAYAYEFSSFAGETVVIPRYVADISALNLSLHNSGSYIVNATVTYTSGGKRHERTTRISGGLTGQITDIPLDATNVDIRMAFAAGTTQVLRVSNPLNTWFLGRGEIELTGWWPGASGANWK